MVTITDFKKRTSEEGKEFNVLLLQGDLELIQSKASGRFYATAKTCTIPCTFNDVICASLVGKTLPGQIEKMACDPYDYHIPGTDEIISLAHTYYYDPVERTMEQEVFGIKAA
ncbi:hypothetical protein ABID22_000332 [Pontibacter aydingkolensis]|uniref:Uncharacterized protein n=1 Tax=Pontibacter aydingkolensis TaxID=1911536 RepID=A0ABS7CQC7_9BACT|nr:hypothetical protein [Pontibacter aydingkolensis]MBW7466003.1 hypothetical protein [Pontibacter aydingkolensis]